MHHSWHLRVDFDDFEISLDGFRPNDDATRQQSRAGVERLVRGLEDHRVRPVLLEVYAALRGEPVHALERLREQWVVERDLEREFLSAAFLGRLVVRELPRPELWRGAAQEPPDPAPKAKQPAVDKYIRVLLFDATGTAWGPPSAKVDVHLADQSTLALTISGGTAEKTGIPGTKPSACTLEFKGIADASDLVPKEAKPAVDNPGATRVRRRLLARDQLFDGSLNANNVFQLQRRAVDVVEFEQFDKGGSVLWPGAPPDSLELRAGAPMVLGIESLRAAFEQALGCDADQVLITGHDGDVSQERADGVKALLVGDADARKAWVALTLAHSTVTDQQAILGWAATEFGWACDPGDCDGKKGPKTEAAIRSFQKSYNGDQDAGLFPAPNPDGPLKVDGIIGKFTTGAMFDCVQRALEGDPSDSSPGSPPTRQGALAAPGPKAVGCAAHHLQSPFSDSPERRAANRAVEVLFIGAGEAPVVVCAKGTATPCTAKTCELYDPREYSLAYMPLNVPGVSDYPFSA